MANYLMHKATAGEEPFSKPQYEWKQDQPGHKACELQQPGLPGLNRYSQRHSLIDESGGVDDHVNRPERQIGKSGQRAMVTPPLA